LQSALVVQPVPGFGTHAPLVQVKPVAQGEPVGPAVQLGTHAPSSQTSPEAHWFEYLQTVVVGSHEPETHVSPLEQSEFAAHGQGPLVPPQVTHASW
jgi:hypothetical protein